MKWLRYALILLCLIISYSDFAQTLKITSVGSDNKSSQKILEKQFVGKTIELKLYKDSASVTIPALHKGAKMRQTGPDQYHRVDNADEESSFSLLTISRTADQLTSINLRMVIIDNEAGDKTDIWIIAKPQ